MPLTPEQTAALQELKSRGSLTDEQVAAYEELQRRGKSPLQLQHEHNVNLEAVAQDARLKSPGWFPNALKFDEPLGVASQAIAEGTRAASMFGGPLGAVAGEAGAQEIEMAGGAREGYNPLAIGAQAAIPGAVRLVGKAARPLAKDLYGSALKLSTTIKPEKRARILETGLNEGRIATTKGLFTKGSIEKSQAKLKAIEAEIEAKIATRAEAPINSQAVASRIDDVAPRFETVNPEADRAILQGAKEEFVRNYPALGATKAQDLKKKTYKVLGERAYGEQKTAGKEAEKALARGLKEELERHFPELKQLNASAGALIDLNKALERAANRVGNRDVMGIGIPLKTEAFGKAGFLAGLMDAPGVKQRLAIAIDKARHLQKVSPTVTAAIGRGATMPSAWEE